MTNTPWGPVADLRERGPVARDGVPEATPSQRERLYGAATVAIAEKGYGQATVADIIELAGVSRATFYENFDDKRGCFVATYDALIDGILAQVTAAFETDRPWRERLAAAFAKLLELIAAYPAAAHMCLVDVHAAGPDMVRHSERTAAAFEALLRRAIDESPERAGLPAVVTRGIIGGTVKVITSRVRRGMAGELPTLVPALAAWALSYHTPPGSIRRPRPPRHPIGGGPQFSPYGDAGRILAATVAEVSEKGYESATLVGIATRAGASAHTFYKHFDSKHDALVAAYDAGFAQAYSFSQPAFEQAGDWGHGFRAALQAMFTFLAGDPAWTRMAVIESPSAGRVMLARTDEAIDQFAVLLRPGCEQAPGMGEVAIEACAGAIYALHYDQISRHGPERLAEVVPACTYLGLAPFIGAERALAVANEGEGASPRRRAPSGGSRTPAHDARA